MHVFIFVLAYLIVVGKEENDENNYFSSNVKPSGFGDKKVKTWTDVAKGLAKKDVMSEKKIRK